MITRQTRQEIIKAYAQAHNGRFDPHGFLEEVRERGPSHPAYEWFTWNDQEAAAKWLVEEARRFAQGLKVVFQIKKITGGKVTVAAPLVHSPMQTRKEGGGYVVTMKSNRNHTEELRSQALRDLMSWQKRYESVLQDGAINEQITSIAQSLGLISKAA